MTKTVAIVYGPEKAPDIGPLCKTLRIQYPNELKTRPYDASIIADNGQIDPVDYVLYLGAVADHQKEATRQALGSHGAHELADLGELSAVLLAGTTGHENEPQPAPPVTIPDNYEKLKWPALYKLATEIAGPDRPIAKKADAIAVIEAELKKREG